MQRLLLVCRMPFIIPFHCFYCGFITFLYSIYVYSAVLVINFSIRYLYFHFGLKYTYKFPGLVRPIIRSKLLNWHAGIS